ncbi:hypothetical protein [Corynebacterium glucuronolyticum]|uniref:Iron complex transport system substrate-binding protein n=2 Tax=Corynebacterium glucuronolyticum TaxID=39791 RepID=A0A7T4JUL9_9CORY|nr:hypothetical protein [Corynebacterium glucuronolyticum]EEI27372.1 hypothetical protein HMPREF0294_1119 [Corynebacterium glucuronolyticum ATCC 51867]EEI62780.1 hypothetical protein HMPREF0293_1929 [Corynebacterium glucuronolyticum ATCC 51866]QQB45975.1 hypothetical protein I6I10_10975 [Corynebacterium glucuronolyticum]QRO83483.1 hypothetical protein I6J20_04990 [Corynebacterium glucuronolyticum]QRP71511.1 hypothetical protein I6J21_05145 [Corynebacterium glucuronolyticum]
MKKVFSRSLALAIMAAVNMNLAGCSSDTTNSATSSPAAADSSHGFTFENCGHEITVDGVPQKVLLVNRIGVVPTLYALGVLSDVHMRAGAFAPEYFASSPELKKKVDSIPNLTEKVDPTGHLQISKEEVVDGPNAFVKAYSGSVMSDLPLATADSPERYADIFRAAGLQDVSVTWLPEITTLDDTYGTAPGHES